MQLVGGTALPYFVAAAGLELPQASANLSKPFLLPRHCHTRKKGVCSLILTLKGPEQEDNNHANRMRKDAYKGAGAEALLGLPPTKVAKTT